MAYLHATGGEPIPLETIATLGRLLGLAIPEEDLEALSVALRDQLAAIDAIESLDLSGVAPPVQFDPRWHD